MGYGGYNERLCREHMYHIWDMEAIMRGYAGGICTMFINTTKNDQIAVTISFSN